MPTPDPLLARNLRLVREAAKMSRREVAAAAGISQSFIEKIELGYFTPSRKTVRALARVLGVTIAYLGQDLIAPARTDRPQDVGLAKVIRDAREAAGMSREKLAGRGGIRPSFFMDIEIGRRMPSRATRRALAAALHVPEAKLRAAASKWRRFPIGGVVQGLRRGAGLTRAQVATAAGISRSYLASIERGVAVPSAETVDGLAGALRVGAADLREHLDGPVHHRAWGGEGRRRAG